MSKHDIVVYGATGFTGVRTARYLAKEHGLRLAIAGRDPAKLEAVARSLGRDVGVIVATSNDPASIDRMAQDARVVVSTVGPYRAYGSPVVDACVKHGAHYADITGEPVWVRDMIDKHHANAEARRVKIVPFCGYDSIPSDLGAYLCVKALRRDHGETCRRVEAFHSFKGGINGGTFATVIEFGESGDLPRMRLPFLLSEGPRPNATVERESQDPTRAFFHPKVGRWVAPFVMGMMNSRVVRRSASLDGRYGDDFVYQEYWKAPMAAAAHAMAVGMVAGKAAVQNPLARRLMKRFGPKPGVGPSEDQIENGYFKTVLYAEGDSGSEVSVEISGKGDPGNSATVRFLGESALALAEGRDLPDRYGVLTPVSGIGEVLVDRLRRREMKIEVTPLSPRSRRADATVQ